MGDDVSQSSLEQPQEALPAGIDHAGLAQNRQHRWRLRNRFFGCLDRGGENRLEIAALFGNDHGRRRSLSDYRQDRTLDRLDDGLVRSRRSLSQRPGKVGAVETLPAAQPFGHAPKYLRGDDAGVAPSAHERPEADGGGYSIGRPAGHSIRLGQCRAHRGEHVAAGVAVRHGEYVERVHLVDMVGKVVDGGVEGRQESGSVTGSARHRATRCLILAYVFSEPPFSRPWP